MRFRSTSAARRQPETAESATVCATRARPRREGHQRQAATRDQELRSGSRRVGRERPRWPPAPVVPARGQIKSQTTPMPEAAAKTPRDKERPSRRTARRPPDGGGSRLFLRLPVRRRTRRGRGPEDRQPSAGGHPSGDRGAGKQPRPPPRRTGAEQGERRRQRRRGRDRETGDHGCASARHVVAQLQGGTPASIARANSPSRGPPITCTSTAG